jgi:hypothetical protein
MKRKTLAALFGFGLFATLAAPAESQTGITEQEAHAIGVNAYLYFYPLLSMDLTRRQSTNIEPGKSLRPQRTSHVCLWPFVRSHNDTTWRFGITRVWPLETG